LNGGKTFFILFRSIHDVLRAEKYLKKTGAVFELVPVPRQISSECGVCIKSTTSLKDLFSHSAAPGPDRCYIYEAGEYTLLDPENC
jgi:hypothetical protein